MELIVKMLLSIENILLQKRVTFKIWPEMLKLKIYVLNNDS